MRSKVRFSTILVALLLIALAVSACGTSSPRDEAPAPTEPPTAEEPAEPTEPEPGAADKDLSAAFVYVAPIGDLGWTYAHDLGRLMMEEELGIETAFIESVPEGPDAERVIRDFAEKGYDLVFTTSFGYMDPTIAVAGEYPEKQFVHISGFKTAPNSSTVFGRMYQPRYLSGLVAGSMTESDVIGFVAAFPIPEVVRGINAFTLGVKEANPDAEVRVVWTNTWFGPPEEKEAAEALLDQGADVIAQHQDTTEPQKAAKNRGVYSIGYDSDMAEFVGDTVLTSPVWNWGPKYVEIAEQFAAGTYDGSEQYWGGLDDNVVALAEMSPLVPDEVKVLVAEKEQAIVDGSMDVFCGPLVAANGVEVLPEGKCMTDGEMLGMDFFLDGVRGEAPGDGAALEGQDAPAGAVAMPALDLSAAFVYVAPIGDLGWTYAHDLGRLMMEEELGIETAFIESVPEGPDAERVIRDFAEKGYDLVFTTSFGYMDPTIAVAGEYPEKQFVHISGFKTAPNSSTVFGRMYQPRYLSGLVAGSMTESDVIGFVAAFPIPEVVRGINAFTLGVKEANPDAEVRVVWTNTWFGPPEEKEAAEALLDQGADVIAQHQDTTEPQKAAKNRGVYSIGYDSDMAEFVGDTVLTSPVWNWGPKYVEIAEQFAAGTYDGSEQYWGGLDDNVVALAEMSPLVPDEVKVLVAEKEQAIVDGSMDVFCGPLVAANGVEVLPEGKCMTDGEMLGMDFFLDGVRGEAPGDGAALEGQDAPKGMMDAGATGELPSAAFVYVGPVNDFGWTYAHDQGRQAIEAMGVETAYAELVGEGPDAARVIRDFAEKGYDIVFATSFGYMDSVIEVAGEYPDTVFEHATGYKTADNVGIYDGRGYQGWYLAGIVAGSTTESNKLGYIAPYPIPEVVRNMNAFALGARSVNPDAEVNPIWIFDWVNPPKEREAAEALADLGIDVIARESDSTEADKLAQEKGIYVVGYNADATRDQAADAFLTAPIWHWDTYYMQVVQDVADGSWTSEPVWWGLKEGLMSLAPIADFVPEDVKALVEAEQKRILSGDFDVFEGPINDNQGSERVAAGASMTDGEKLSFDWLVEGVIGDIPQ
ncbi:MAG: BMP family ABC transporter substrate-binding protein [Chloroflexota bacterium]|nr:BMP family ABC transporter substrate-binding protein [Chloroflexota bacterium]